MMVSVITASCKVSLCRASLNGSTTSSSCAQHCRSEKALLWVGQIGASQAGLLL